MKYKVIICELDSGKQLQYLFPIDIPIALATGSSIGEYAQISRQLSFHLLQKPVRDSEYNEVINQARIHNNNQVLNLLYLEDNTDVSQSVIEFLSSSTCIIDHFKSPVTFINKVNMNKKNTPRHNLILVDNQFCGFSNLSLISGVEFIKLVRQGLPSNGLAEAIQKMLFQVS